MMVAKLQKRSGNRYFLLAALLTSGLSQAAIDLANAPLETGTTVDPNIMFIIDDSGSMQQGMMPEGLEDSAGISSRCSRDDYADQSLCFYDLDGRRYLASSYLNKLYYNPSVTYKTPLKADGSVVNTVSFTSALVDGYDSGSSRINLSNNYRAIMSGSANGTSTGARANFTVSPDGEAGAAFYFTFTAGCSSAYSDSCYTYRTLSTTAEKQNFANWYSFYRTRILAAKAGIGDAFYQQGTAMRVGYVGINNRDSLRGVRQFSGTNRSDFFTWLYGVEAGGGTPLREALTTAGNYFQTKEPWRTDPASSGSALLECRQNFSILMTDGYYSEADLAIGEHDNNQGATITGPRGRTFTYQPTGPFASAYSETLADVAMKYWRNDLDAGWSSSERLANTVPTSSENPAFWQHMVTFGVGFGVQGSISPVTAFNAISSGSTINWPATDTDTGKIDDLLHAGVNSRGGFFSASNPEIFASELSNTLSTIAERVGTSSNIAATAINSLQTESNLYQARYVAGEWSGDLWSYSTADTTTAVWKASEQLPAPAARKIFYGSDAGTAKEFLWSNMSTAERLAITGTDVVSYIRGDTSKEKRNGGSFRNRIRLLGDLVNSSPELVQAPFDLNYQRQNWAGASTYRTFLQSAASRTPMIYVGGNDGMLHGFNANTGVEVFAYIPKAVMAPLPASTTNVLNLYAQPNYVHRYSVDGSPIVADVVIGTDWRSILIGSLGRGGNGLFAIDVTNPATFGNSAVLWDKTYTELGQYLGTPQITRTESGKWVVVVGYGYNNTTHKSGVLIIDITTGNIVKNMPTSAGSSTDPNGMSEVNLLDIDNDGNTDWIYGGDYHGYVWKFDISSSNETLWALAYSGQPLFQAKNSTGGRQKITGGVLSSVEAKTGNVWLYFGTGAYLGVNDPNNQDQQTWYGIMDGQLITGRSVLESRTITNVGDQRVISQVTSMGGTSRGWYMDLIDTRERIVDPPLMVGTELLMNTTIPDTNACNPSGSGYLMVVSPYTGGRLAQTYFDLNNDNVFNDSDKVTVSSQSTVVSGIKVSSLNSVTRLAKVGDLIKSFNNCEGGCIEQRTIDPNRNTGMQSWRELAN